jgi:hypothetical protein
MSTIAAGRDKTSDYPWGTAIFLLSIIAALVLFMIYVVTPWANAKDARDARHAAEQLAAIHKQGFVNVASSDLYESSYYDGPTAFMYPVGTCSIELVIDGSGANSRPYIWLNGIDNSVLYVTYRQLTHIPQTEGCFSR